MFKTIYFSVRILSINSNGWKSNLFVRKNNDLYDCLYKPAKGFVYLKSVLQVIERKLNLKGVIFESDLNHFRFKKLISLPIIAAHVRFKQYIMSGLYKLSWRLKWFSVVFQSNIYMHVLSIELHTERLYKFNLL